MEKHWRYLFHTKLAYDTYDMRVCHDIDLRSFGQVNRSLERKVQNLFILYISFMEKHWKFLLHKTLSPEGIYVN